LEGVVPVLQYLKHNGQKIALGSASKNARPILEKVNILHFFDAIVDGNDVTNAKPDPEVFLRAAQLVGASASDSIVFEDSVAGVQAANIAGMVSIGIGDAKTLHEAQYNFNDFTEIHTDFLQTLVKK
jgi:beta-phosphoglucomutase